MSVIHNDVVSSGALFSECRKYRYALWRQFEIVPTLHCVFIGLNPSTADESIDDPTIKRCIGFAKRFNAGCLLMLNAYAFRATEPKVMQRQLDPIGHENDRQLLEIPFLSLVIAAWGAHCSESRQRKVCELVNRRIYCLGKTKDGKPKHPLYLKSDTQLEIFWEPNVADEQTATRDTTTGNKRAFRFA